MGCGADMSVPKEESSLQMVIYLTAGSAFCEFCENSAQFLGVKPYFSAFFYLEGPLAAIFPRHDAEFR